MKKILAMTVAAVLLSTGISAPTWAQPPKMKMTTDIPEAITTPDSVETRLGALSFFDGYPDDATTQKVYDNLDFMRGVEAFLNAVPGASAEAIRTGWGGVQGIRVIGITDSTTFNN